MKSFPQKWFFFDPSLKESVAAFNKCSKDTGIIFFNYKKNNQIDFLKSIQKFICICKKHKIKFLLQSSVFWALKYCATGIFVSFNEYKQKKYHRASNFKKNKKDLLIISTCHNIKEILLAKKIKCDFIFISPAFTTNTHKNFIPHNSVNFIKLCYTFASDVFALGGVSEKNIFRLKNKYLKGFGGITYFKKLL
tara:strand:- start:636 stop:1214 length:579 start_codon:yes stop_codon:yes gene_type:complete